MVNAAKERSREIARKLRAEHARDPAPPDTLAPLLADRPELRAAKTVALYIPCHGEPDTVALCAYCHETGKTVAVPAWNPTTRAYSFYELRRGATLIESRFGVREPAEKIPVATETIDLFLAPGLLFDVSGCRLGHGKGFYDRLLAPRRPDAPVWGIAFDWQISHTSLPNDPHDIRMDALCVGQAFLPVTI